MKILHYVENSFEDKPSWVILMDDNKEYISNGCVFTEKTEANIKALIEEYDCKKYLDELFKAPSIEFSELVNGSHMFYDGCTSLVEPADTPLLTDGYYMYDGCTKIKDKHE